MLLKDIVETLDEDEYEIVLLYVLGNYTHKQIAEGLSKPIGTITWKYQEALKKLRTKLEV
jgi:RNA polymerase sigma-70 factor (ECF subfamily)